MNAPKNARSGIGLTSIAEETAAPERADARPLSFVQEKLWSLNQFTGPSAVYNIPLALRLRGDVDEAALLRSLETIVDRHDSLRTRFEVQGGSAVQVIEPTASMSVQVEKIGSEAQVETICREERRYRFELSKERLCRVRLLRKQREEREAGVSEYVLLVTMHHSVSDGWSVGVFFRELVALYEAYAKGESSPLPALPIQYADYAQWQRQWLKGGVLERQLRYWRGQLSGLPPVLDLPTDRPRPAVQTFRAAMQPFGISKPLQDQLQELSRQAGVTMFMTLLSGFAVLLSRYAGQTDVAIGTPVANRARGETEGLIGFFVNTLVLRSDLSDEPRFVDFLKRTREVVLQAYAHQDVPFEHLAEVLNPQRSLSHSPLFQASFSLLSNLPDAVSLSGVSIAPVQLPNEGEDGVARYDLTFHLHEAEQGIVGKLEYNTDLFDRSTMQRLLANYERLLRAIVTRPEERVSRYEFLSDADKHRQLVEWNATQRAYSQEQCVHELFEAQVRKTPDAVALRFEGNQLTYEALNRAANRVAHYLAAQTMGPDKLVGLCVERSLEMVVGIVGILKAGGAYVPIDPKYPPERIAYLLEDSGVRIVLSQSHLVQRLSFARRQVIWLDDNHGALAKQSEKNITRTRSGSSSMRPAYLIYTSGSSGEPKGVLGSHRGITNRIHWLSRQFPFASDEIFCQRASISSVDHVAEIFQSLALGVALVIVPEPVLTEANHFADVLANHRITSLCVLPSTLRALMSCADISKVRSLKYVFSTGDVLTTGLARRFFKCFSRARLFNVYGSTEVGADVSCYEVSFDAHVDIAGYFRGSPPGALHDAKRTLYSTESAAEGSEAITRSDVTLNELRIHFEDSTVPEKPIRPEEYIESLRQGVLPYLVNVSSQVFIGHMTSALPTFMPELSKVVAQLNQNMVKVETSKALTLLERQVLAMMHRLFFRGADADYASSCQDPTRVFGVVTSGGSTSNITALVCARNSGLLRLGVTKRELAERGATAILRQRGFSRAVLLASRLAHYSVKKAASLLGMGENDVVIVAQDDDQQLCIEDLCRCIERSRMNGEFIVALIGIAGATETGTIDPLEEMARVANDHGIHFHVDAAWGGGLVFSEKHRSKLTGIERADTVTFCAHKQLYTPQGLSLCLFRDSLAAHANSFHADYQARVGSYDMGQYTLEGSRPATSLMLHAVLHLFANQGLGWLVDRTMAMTAHFRSLIESSAEFELIGNPQMNIVNYRYVPKALRQVSSYCVDQNREISRAVEKMQEQQFLAGRAFVSKTRILNRLYCPEPITVFRAVLASPLTTEADLRRVLHDQLQIAQECVELSSEQMVFADAPKRYARAPLDEDQARIPIGKPISNSKIYILDRLRHPVPIGVVGEICVAGDGLAAGYLGRDSLTAESFIDNPFEPGERLYRTGDLGRIRADGNIDFLGRVDRQVKIRGFRIELGEIEAQLLRIEGVFDCAVLARQFNGAEKRLIAYVVPEKSRARARTMTEALLRDALSQAIPEYMVPEFFVLLEELPLTRRGKVDRQNLLSA